MTSEAVASAALAFAWGFVAALWLHDPIKGLIHRMVDMAMRDREGK